LTGAHAMSLNLAVMLVENAKRLPQHPAIRCEGRTMSYAELNAAANRFANVLTRLGLNRGQKVMLMLPNIPEFVVCYYGTLQAGGVVVPVNVLYKARETEFLLGDSESVVYVACEEFLAEAVEGFQRVKTCQHLLVVPFPRAARAVDGPGLHRFDELMQ